MIMVITLIIMILMIIKIMINRMVMIIMTIAMIMIHHDHAITTFYTPHPCGTKHKLGKLFLTI